MIATPPDNEFVQRHPEQTVWMMYAVDHPFAKASNPQHRAWTLSDARQTAGGGRSTVALFEEPDYSGWWQLSANQAVSQYEALVTNILPGDPDLDVIVGNVLFKPAVQRWGWLDQFIDLLRKRNLPIPRIGVHCYQGIQGGYKGIDISDVVNFRDRWAAKGINTRPIITEFGVQGGINTLDQAKAAVATQVAAIRAAGLEAFAWAGFPPAAGRHPRNPSLDSHNTYRIWDHPAGQQDGFQLTEFGQALKEAIWK